jgi:hypothetical protein
VSSDGEVTAAVPSGEIFQTLGTGGSVRLSSYISLVGVWGTKFIKIQQANRVIINFLKLEAIDLDGRDVALKKFATASCVHGSGSLGLNNPLQGVGSSMFASCDDNYDLVNDLFHQEHWWQVDLGQDYIIARVLFTNRNDWCLDRIIGSTVRLISSNNVELFRSSPLPSAYQQTVTVPQDTVLLQQQQNKEPPITLTIVFATPAVATFTVVSVTGLRLPFFNSSFATGAVCSKPQRLQCDCFSCVHCAEWTANAPPISAFSCRRTKVVCGVPHSRVCQQSYSCSCKQCAHIDI